MKKWLIFICMWPNRWFEYPNQNFPHFSPYEIPSRSYVCIKFMSFPFVLCRFIDDSLSLLHSLLRHDFICLTSCNWSYCGVVIVKEGKGVIGFSFKRYFNAIIGESAQYGYKYGEMNMKFKLKLYFCVLWWTEFWSYTVVAC